MYHVWAERSSLSDEMDEVIECEKGGLTIRSSRRMSVLFDLHGRLLRKEMNAMEVRGKCIMRREKVRTFCFGSTSRQIVS